MGLHDLRAAANGQEITADILIIGGGMAGATLAREFVGSRVRVAVLESGGLTPDPEVQDLSKGTGVLTRPDGSTARIDDYLSSSRVRALGGSGNRWGRRCCPLEDADFSQRDWIPDSGWPFARPKLQPYYDRACDHLKIPRFVRDYRRELEPGRPPFDVSADFLSTPAFYSPCSGRRGDPAAWAEFRQGYATAPNIQVYLNANVAEIALDPRSGGVEHLVLACLGGTRHSAQAKAYVLATGGIENARLLLASTSVRPEGVANRSGLVGRYFTGHVGYGIEPKKGEPGSAIAFTTAEPPEFYDLDVAGRVSFSFGAERSLQARERIGAFELNLYHSFPSPADDALEALLRVAAAVDGRTEAPARHYVCGFQAEAFPLRESRITLASEADALGMPRAHLSWTWSAAHWRTLERGIDAFASALGVRGRGRLAWPLTWPDHGKAAEFANHHIGATRMHRNRDRGVVNADCRSHDVGNLYVAGSSVFPTGGVANPTLTIIALAIRLADHLKSTVGRRA